ncbi:hypothetical protein E4U53_001498 [Claviceps sorghi]|nr:hypothetical protein E4U53_001498 [Claviceps sorghi]
MIPAFEEQNWRMLQKPGARTESRYRHIELTPYQPVCKLFTPSESRQGIVPPCFALGYTSQFVIAATESGQPPRLHGSQLGDATNFAERRKWSTINVAATKMQKVTKVTGGSERKPVQIEKPERTSRPSTLSHSSAWSLTRLLYM